jgi:hypothetical protein
VRYFQPPTKPDLPTLKIHKCYPEDLLSLSALPALVKAMQACPTPNDTFFRVLAILVEATEVFFFNEGLD